MTYWIRLAHQLGQPSQLRESTPRFPPPWTKSDGTVLSLDTLRCKTRSNVQCIMTAIKSVTSLYVIAHFPSKMESINVVMSVIIHSPTVEIYYFDVGRRRWLTVCRDDEGGCHDWETISSPPIPSGIWTGIGEDELSSIAINAITTLEGTKGIEPHPSIKRNDSLKRNE